MVILGLEEVDGASVALSHQQRSSSQARDLDLRTEAWLENGLLARYVMILDPQETSHTILGLCKPDLIF